MEHHVEKDMAKEKILEVKSAPGDAEVKESKPLYRRRKCQLCCCIVLGFVVLMGVIIIILVFSVFKPKDPNVWINSVKLADLNTTQGTLIPQIRLMLDLNISVHNPNRAGFKYTNSSSILYYQEIEVGHADIPAGQLGAGKTKTMVVILDVQVERFLRGSNFTKDFAAGLIPVSSTTQVSGRVNVLNIYKVHAVSYSWCTMSVFLANQTLANYHCRYSLRNLTSPIYLESWITSESGPESNDVYLKEL